MLNHKYARQYEQALRYEAGAEDVNHLLTRLSSPEHTHTRRGTGPAATSPWKADHTFRMATADALRDQGRHGEADLLQDPERHVVVQGGQVLPGRFTTAHVDAHHQALHNWLGENLYESPTPPPVTDSSYLHETGRPQVGVGTHGHRDLIHLDHLGRTLAEHTAALPLFHPPLQNPAHPHHAEFNRLLANLRTAPTEEPQG